MKLKFLYRKEIIKINNVKIKSYKNKSKLKKNIDKNRIYKINKRNRICIYLEV